MTKTEIEALGANLLPQLAWTAEPVDTFPDAPVKVVGETDRGEAVQFYVFKGDETARVANEFVRAFNRYQVRTGRGW